MKIAGMLRVRNESRWIERVLRAIEPLCEFIAVLDDHSTDDTFGVALTHALDNDTKYLVTRSEFEGVNETRDKQYLLDRIKTWCSPDWVLHIDGDEELEPAGVEAIHDAIRFGTANAYNLQVLYLWDRENQIRTDGLYRNFRVPSLFNVHATNGQYNPTAFGGGRNLHCSRVPADLANQSSKCDARLLHYGYIDRSMRLAKYDHYNTVDPHNLIEDCYRHVVQGDIPEVPVGVKLKHAGPRVLEPFTVRTVSTGEAGAHQIYVEGVAHA